MNDLLTRMREPVTYIPLIYPTIAVAMVMATGAVMGAFKRMMARLILTITKSRKLTLFIMNHVTFPGTIIHELSHALMAVLTGARVTEISFFPKGDTLGHVNYMTRGGIISRMMQLSLTSCAPVLISLCLQIPFYIAAKNGVFNSWPLKAAAIYLDMSIIMHADMSKTDIENYLRGLKILLPFSWAAALILSLIL